MVTATLIKELDPVGTYLWLPDFPHGLQYACKASVHSHFTSMRRKVIH